MPRACLVIVMAMLCPGAARADYFLHGYYTPTEGRVGQYLVSDAAFSVNDMPDSCVPDWRAVNISGALPPGMDVSNSFSTTIAGTPTLPGDWQAAITIRDLGCTVGQAPRADRTIKVSFHISP